MLQIKNSSLKDRMPYKGVLLDIYGVLEYKGEPCAGALDFINHLLNKNIPFRLLSNSTLQSRQSMAEKLQKLGFTGAQRSQAAHLGQHSRKAAKAGLHRGQTRACGHGVVGLGRLPAFG